MDWTAGTNLVSPFHKKNCLQLFISFYVFQMIPSHNLSNDYHVTNCYKRCLAFNRFIRHVSYFVRRDSKNPVTAKIGAVKISDT